MDLSKIYTLTYRFGANPHPLLLNFQFEGKLIDAITRGRRFCETVGYRFHSVRPLVDNLESIERRHLGTDTDYPAQQKKQDLGQTA